MRRLLLAAMLALGLLVQPAGGEPADDCRLLVEGDGDSEVCRVEAWFQATDAAVGNLGFTGAFAYPSWGPQPPTTSTADGGGAASVSENYVGSANSDGEYVNAAIFDGDFRGNIDTVGFHLYVAQPHRFACPPASCFPTTAFRLRVTEGELLLYDSGQRFEQVPVADRTAEFFRLDFAVAGIHERMLAAGVPTGPGVDHRLRIELTADPPTAYRYDASDTPSGLVFNPLPDELGAYAILPAG